MLTTNFKLVMSEDDQVLNILSEISKKVGEASLNPKQFVFVPIYKNGMGREKRVDSDLGGDNNLDDSIEYDTNFIDYQTKIKNMKTNCIELTEKRYVDKPANKQKDVPIENQHGLASTFVMNNNMIPNRNTLIIGADEEEKGYDIPNQTHHFSVALQSTKPYNAGGEGVGKPSFNDEFINIGNKEHRKENDFLFGSISAAKHQEFNVIKINKRKKRQARVFGIDGNNIYNCKKSSSE